MRFEGKAVLVTGGGSGIGLATALAFAGEGARVAIADASEEHGREALAKAREAGCELRFIRGDVSHEADAARMVEETVAAFGRLDVLFNNAGILVEGPLHQLSEADWDRQIDVNLKGAFLVAKHAVRQMLGQGCGSIVNTGSVDSLAGDADAPAYAASKGGIAQLTRSLALAYAKDGIRVNAVCPGWTDTRMFRQEAEARRVPLSEYRGHAGTQHPMGRIGRPEEIAKAVLFLASDDASYTTGTLVVVDGGYLAK